MRYSFSAIYLTNSLQRPFGGPEETMPALQVYLGVDILCGVVIEKTAGRLDGKQYAPYKHFR